LGLAYNNLAQFTLAKYHLETAEKLFLVCMFEEYQYSANYNLFIIAYNLHDLKSLKELNRFFEKWHRSDKNNISSMILSLMYYVAIEDLDKCGIIIDKLFELKADMQESDYSIFYINCFMYAIKRNDLLLAKKILIDVKMHKKYFLTENYKFMKKLLDFYADNSPLYLKHDDFKAGTLLYRQIYLIKYLDEGNVELAHDLWNELKSEFPGMYHNNFHYHGPVNIFSRCLDKIGKPREKEYQISRQLDSGDKVEKLKHILQTSNGPILKEKLYSLIWGTKAQTKDDLAKLARLIYRLKKQYNLDVKTKRGSYLIVNKDQKQAS
jgi:hypothetical protein